jgi:hypothetical protein
LEKLEERGQEISSAVLSQLSRQVDGRSAIDPAVFRSGGKAFQWEDVLGLSDAVAATSGMIANLPVGDAALILVGLLEFWRRLRRVRLSLTENEMRILLAVKHGCVTVNAIAASSSLDPVTVASLVQGLRSRVYHDRVALISGDEGGLYTEF